jgi:hypothetical protein
MADIIIILEEIPPILINLIEEDVIIINII